MHLRSLLERLVGSPCERPEDVVRWLCAVQAQDYAGAKWARRYLASHGPALVKDFAWWSGLTLKEARAGIEMDHRVVGGWRRAIQRKAVTVTMNLPLRPKKREKAALQSAIERYSRFLGVPVTISS